MRCYACCRAHVGERLLSISCCPSCRSTGIAALFRVNYQRIHLFLSKRAPLHLSAESRCRRQDLICQELFSGSGIGCKQVRRLRPPERGFSTKACYLQIAPSPPQSYLKEEILTCSNRGDSPDLQERSNCNDEDAPLC